MHQTSTYALLIMLSLLLMVEMKQIDSSVEETMDETDELLKESEDEQSVEPQANCAHECTTGSPIQNPDHKPGFNGCGSYGVNVDLKKCPYLTSCCNEHDVCYDKCGTSRDKCDTDFKICTQNPTVMETRSADNKGLCKSFGMVMYYVVRMAGCPAFKNAQKNACTCAGIDPMK